MIVNSRLDPEAAWKHAAEQWEVAASEWKTTARSWETVAKTNRIGRRLVVTLLIAFMVNAVLILMILFR